MKDFLKNNLKVVYHVFFKKNSPNIHLEHTIRSFSLVKSKLMLKSQILLSTVAKCAHLQVLNNVLEAQTASIFRVEFLPPTTLLGDIIRKTTK